MSSKQDLQPLLDVEQNQLDLVFSDSNGIDAKALAILGANVAALLFVDDAKLAINFWHFVVVYLPFILSLLLDIVSLWPRKYWAPIPEQAHLGEYISMEIDSLQLQLLADTQASITHNSELNRKRLRLCTISLALTGLGFLAILFIL